MNALSNAARASLAVLVLVVPAGALRAQPALPAGISEEELFGTMIRNSRWPSTSIHVCWADPAPTQEVRAWRAITREAVEATWERNSAIRFVGWGSCASDTADGIHIVVAEDTPHTLGVGQQLDKRPDGMVLNFTFASWSPSCQLTKDFCVRAIAAHEFGHALGFTHEQNRDDAPAECKKESSGSWGDYKVTEYDPYSIMNYCNPDWLGDGMLSELDIKAVQKVYGQ